jgi:pimeloyl-ACP methyl ester carboxylesterase
MHVERLGSGPPLLLLHGLGGSWRSFDPVVPALAAERELIAIDLPGFGMSPPLAGTTTVGALVDAVAAFLGEHGLLGVDVLGSSLGARLALDLARRGEVGATVALDPGGFWTDRQRFVVALSLAAQVKLARVLMPAIPAIAATPVGRTAALAQLSARPWALGAELVTQELTSIAAHPEAVDATLAALIQGRPPEGAPSGSLTAPVTIGWGRQDRLTVPSQAHRAQERFPDAQLHWFDRCGHFPQWDQPEETARLVLERTAVAA